VSGVRAPTPSGYRGRGMERVFAQIVKNYHAVINCFDNGKLYGIDPIFSIDCGGLGTAFPLRHHYRGVLAWGL
jgi:hypothetical protein